MKKISRLRTERIIIQKEISEIFEKGTRISDKYLKIFVSKNNRPIIRFMIVINKKFGNAVSRNKAKRHIRELFRINREFLSTGYDIIFFIKNDFKNINFLMKMENISKLLIKSQLVKK